MKTHVYLSTIGIQLAWLATSVPALPALGTPKWANSANQNGPRARSWIGGFHYHTPHPFITTTPSAGSFLIKASPSWPYGRLGKEPSVR